MMWYWGGGIHWWGWLAGTVGMVAFWVLVVWGLWYLVTGSGRARGGAGAAPPSAKDILDQRLARGEISPEEYRQARDLITGADRRGADGGPPESKVASRP